MTKLINKLRVIDVNADNVHEVGVYCIKNKKASGYHKKVEWFESKINKGLTLKIACDEAGKQLGFIEFIPSELAWRPVHAKNFYFIQCIVVFSKEVRNQNVGSLLIEQCEQEARQNGKSGICAMTSEGAWMATKDLFVKNGFEVTDQRDRFDLMVKRIDDKGPSPALCNWVGQQKRYKGWNLIYADQCPWHDKSVSDIKQSAEKHGVKLKVKRLKTPAEAQNAPSGYGTYTLIKDGKVLADHYISKTRFENILKKES